MFDISFFSVCCPFVMASKASLSLWAKLTGLEIDVRIGTQAAHNGAHGVPAGTFTQPMMSVFFTHTHTHTRTIVVII